MTQVRVESCLFQRRVCVICVCGVNNKRVMVISSTITLHISFLHIFPYHTQHRMQTLCVRAPRKRIVPRYVCISSLSLSLSLTL